MVPSLQSFRPRQRHHDRRPHHLRLVHLGCHYRGAVERVWSEPGVGSTEYGDFSLRGESGRPATLDFVASLYTYTCVSNVSPQSWIHELIAARVNFHAGSSHSVPFP
jgi:hypothetical protein